ncbi:putative T7SS-secreted protein [Streptomyces physcomitrii]|uniref:putative T7SS-secreted protein n=1 Tax=Streptomyces physcomitrii TaxID=2724184 RepID=UPI0034089C8B
MSRPPAAEWAVLGEDGDPVPGNPEEVARLGRSLRKTADAIRKQADEIKALSDVEAWKGKAATEFRDQAEEADGKLRKAFKRYDVAAKALGTEVAPGERESYASELKRAQTKADKALEDAKEADSEQKAHAKALDKLPEDTAEDDPGRKKLEGREQAAGSALAQAKRDLSAAKGIRNDAARKAAKAIRDVIENDGLKDGRWDKFKDWVHDNKGWIDEVLEWSGRIATVCGGLSLVVGWIPVIGQALAGILGTIALIATAVSLVGHLALALAGEGSWFDVAMDVVGLATLGIGRGAIAGAKGASQAAKGAARTAAYRQARAKGLSETKAWKEANRLSGGTVRGGAAREAAENAPKGWSPGLARLKEAFSPKAIGGEMLDSVKDLKAFKDIGDLRSARLWREADLRGGDLGLHKLKESLDEVDSSLRFDDVVKGHLDTFQTQTNIWKGTTIFATAADAADKGELFGLVGAPDGLYELTGVKDATTTGNG